MVMTKHRQTVAVNEFVLRQIKGSGKTFSHDLTFQQIAEYAENQLNNYPKSIKTFNFHVYQIKQYSSFNKRYTHS